MTEHFKATLRRIKETLTDTYGDRLRGVVLFGSTARGDDRHESDIDIFVLFQDTISLSVDLKELIRVLYPVQQEQGRPIHPIPVNAQVFNAGEYAIFRRARAEGVTL